MTEIPNPYLELRQGSKVVGRFEVQAGGEVVAGRTGQCPIVIDHASVSRMHARIFRDSHGVYLEDLGSANGTYLNGEPVTKASTLADGATIQLGQKTVRDPVLLVYHDPASRLLRQMGLLPAGPTPPSAPAGGPHPANLPATTPTPTIEKAPERPPERLAERPPAPRPSAPPTGSATALEDAGDEAIGGVVEIVPPRPASTSTARLVIVLAVLGLAFFGGLLFFATRFLKPASTLWNTVQVTPAQVAAGSLLTLQSPDIQPADDLVAMFGGEPVDALNVSPGRLEARLPRLTDRPAGRYEIPLQVRRGELDVFQTMLQYQVIPEIATVPERATVGDEVEVEGSGFAQRRTGVTVLFGDREGELVSATLTKLVVKVPVIARTEDVSVPLRVRVGAFEANAPGRLTVAPRPPEPLVVSFRAEAKGEGIWEVFHPFGRAFILHRSGDAAAVQAELDRFAAAFARASAEPTLRFELRPGGGRWALLARSSTRSQGDTVMSWSSADLESTAAAANAKTPADMVAYWLASVANDFLQTLGRGRALDAGVDAPAYQRALDALVAGAIAAGGTGRPEQSDLDTLDPQARDAIANAFAAIPSGWGRVAGQWHLVLQNLFTPEDGYETHLVLDLDQRDRTLSGQATLSFRGEAVEYGIPVATVSGRLEPGLPPRVRLEGTFNRPVGRLVIEGTLGTDGIEGTFTSSMATGQGAFRGRRLR